MRKDDQSHGHATTGELLTGCCSGFLIGAMVGSLGLLLLGCLSGAVISVGYGFLGLIYIPIVGGVGGGVLGSVVGIISVYRAHDRDG